MGLLIGFLPLMGWRAAKGPTLDACEFSRVMDYNYLVFLYLATIILPALFMATSYAHIYTVVIKQIKQMTLLNGGQRGGNSPTKLRVLGAARKSEVKATQNLSIIVAFFAVCWMPLYTINCVQAFCDECPVPTSFMHGCIVLSHLNSAGNPLLYAYHLKDFRNAFKSLLLCKKSPVHRNPAPSRSGCCTTVAAVTGGGSGTAVNGNDCSGSSSLTCSGSSSLSTVVDCWRRPAKNARPAADAASSAAGDPRSTVKQQAHHEIVAWPADSVNRVGGSCNAIAIIDPSAPVLLSVRQLAE
eukprot:XP_016662581.1 PREDICTED: adenosine receptor A2a-like isoform X2 [Acyrthosiphon pisum]